MRDTLSVTEGALIFHIVSLGTGSGLSCLFMGAYIHLYYLYICGFVNKSTNR